MKVLLILVGSIFVVDGFYHGSVEKRNTLIECRGYADDCGEKLNQPTWFKFFKHPETIRQLNVGETCTNLIVPFKTCMETNVIPRCSEHIDAQMSLYIEAGRKLIDYICATETIPVLQTALASECLVNKTLQREIERRTETSCDTDETKDASRKSFHLLGKEKPADFNPCPLMIESGNCVSGILGRDCGVSWKTVSATVMNFIKDTLFAEYGCTESVSLA